MDSFFLLKRGKKQNKKQKQKQTKKDAVATIPKFPDKYTYMFPLNQSNTTKADLKGHSQHTPLIFAQAWRLTVYGCLVIAAFLLIKPLKNHDKPLQCCNTIFRNDKGSNISEGGSIDTFINPLQYDHHHHMTSFGTETIVTKLYYFMNFIFVCMYEAKFLTESCKKLTYMQEQENRLKNGYFSC